MGTVMRVLPVVLAVAAALSLAFVFSRSLLDLMFEALRRWGVRQSGLRD